MAKSVPLSEGLLYLIDIIQNYRAFLTAKSHFQKLHGGAEIDWYAETERFYYDYFIDKETLEGYGLSKNRCSFEALYNFKITEEMNNTLCADLGKFKFVV